MSRQHNIHSTSLYIYIIFFCIKRVSSSSLERADGIPRANDDARFSPAGDQHEPSHVLVAWKRLRVRVLEKRVRRRRDRRRLNVNYTQCNVHENGRIVIVDVIIIIIVIVVLLGKDAVRSGKSIAQNSCQTDRLPMHTRLGILKLRNVIVVIASGGNVYDVKKKKTTNDQRRSGGQLGL